jgi:hypothetical protein
MMESVTIGDATLYCGDALRVLHTMAQPPAKPVQEAML